MFASDILLLSFKIRLWRCCLLPTFLSKTKCNFSPHTELGENDMVMKEKYACMSMKIFDFHAFNEELEKLGGAKRNDFFCEGHQNDVGFDFLQL